MKLKKYTKSCLIPKNVADRRLIVGVDKLISQYRTQAQMNCIVCVEKSLYIDDFVQPSRSKAKPTCDIVYNELIDTKQQYKYKF